MTDIMYQIMQDCRLRGIQQNELAKRSGLTEASISRYFSDERTPSLRNAEKMAKALGLELRLVKGIGV